MSRYFFFKRPRRNTGYTERPDGTHLSLHAAYAEDEGKYTAGKFRTVYKVSKQDFDILVMLGVIVTNEWHHTGKSFTRNDFYEWEQEEFLHVYTENKPRIAALSKAYSSSDWQYTEQHSLHYVPDFDKFCKQECYYNQSSFLTDEEKSAKDRRHAYISNLAHAGYSSHDRYIMHSETDAEYETLALSRMKDADKVQAAYQKQYGKAISENKTLEAQNTIIMQRNLATTGKESNLIAIATFFYDDEDIYKLVHEVAIAYRKAETIKAEQQAREAERQAQQKAENERKAIAQKKQNDYLQKCLKAGKAESFYRVIYVPELSHVTLEEMNGKYGWFKANNTYNLPIYHTGYKFSDKRTLNHYIKLGQF